MKFMLHTMLILLITKIHQYFFTTIIPQIATMMVTQGITIVNTASKV